MRREALSAEASNIRREALERLAEIADHGCEAASARSFEEGRLAALDALDLGYREGQRAVSEAEIRRRRLELDEALRERGTSRPDRDPIAFEPIVRRSTIVTMTEPESTEPATEVAETANADVDAAEVEEVVESDDA